MNTFIFLTFLFSFSLLINLYKLSNSFLSALFLIQISYFFSMHNAFLIITIAFLSTVKIYPILIEKYHRNHLDQYCIDFFDGFIRHLKTGTSREQAFIQAHTISHPFLKKQIEPIIRGIHNGEDFSILLFNCAIKIDYKPLKHYLISIQTSIDSGQSLLKQMEFFLRKVRKSKQLKFKLKSMASQSKLQAYVCIILPLFFTLALYIIAPNFILPLFTQTLGKLSLAIGFTLLAVGAYWIIILVNKDYIQ